MDNLVGRVFAAICFFLPKFEGREIKIDNTGANVSTLSGPPGVNQKSSWNQQKSMNDKTFGKKQIRIFFLSPCSFQMHDFLPLLVAPTIQIRDRSQPLNFGIFGTIKLSFQIGPTTPGAASPVVVVVVMCSNPLLPLVGITEQTVSFRWKSPLLRLSMFKPVMVRDRPSKQWSRNGLYAHFLC